MATETTSQSALIERLREMGYEVNTTERGENATASLKGLFSYIIIDSGEAHLYDISVSHAKAERILAILAEPDYPVVPLADVAMPMAKALPGSTMISIGLKDALIEYETLGITLSALPSGMVEITFEMSKAEPGKDWLHSIARKQGTRFIPHGGDLSEFGRMVRERAAIILDAARKGPDAAPHNL